MSEDIEARKKIRVEQAEGAEPLPAPASIASNLTTDERPAQVTGDHMQADPNDLWKRSPDRHQNLRLPADLDARLWRYLSAERFRWLIEQRRLYMPRLEQMKHNDHREGTMPEGQVAWWNEAIRTAKDPAAAEIAATNYKKTAWFVDRFRDDWFVNCWTQAEDENFAFWRIYGRDESACNTCGQLTVSSGQSVAITTTFKKLEAALPAHIELGTVQYFDYTKMGNGIANMYEYVMSKRHFYAYESEVRAVTHRGGAAGSKVLEEHFEASMIDGSYAPQVNVHAIIDEIILHPESTATFVKDMKAFCEKNALPQPRISGLSAQ